MTSCNIEGKLINLIKEREGFALQVDESTDISVFLFWLHL
jgi:hypothetical protein